jgi:hypothetical protein
VLIISLVQTLDPFHFFFKRKFEVKGNVLNKISNSMPLLLVDQKTLFSNECFKSDTHYFERKTSVKETLKLYNLC